MVKVNSKFICNQCAHETPKWIGRCPSCGQWNTFSEELVEKKIRIKKNTSIEAVPLTLIAEQDVFRYSTGFNEFDIVLGGGIVPGSLVLIGGDPGIGKSTLLLQIADRVANAEHKVLYLSGEESLNQIRLRSMRLNIENEFIFLINEQNIDYLEKYIEEIDPKFIIIDSIQTVYSEDISSIPGSVSQLRECTARIMKMAKKSDRAFFLVGHVTKDGVLAGPKVLEHMVDVVIYFEGEKQFSFRLVRGIKNRFGASDEIALLEMSGQGLREIINPSQVFLSGYTSSSGTSVVASFEGSRPLLIEIQALVAPTGPGYARRMASGIDQNRLALIIAVLEKRSGFALSAHDVYLKVSGGMFLKDPSVDLGIAAAVISSYYDKAIPEGSVFIGEMGLSGDLRPVAFLEKRLKEIEKLGFEKVILPLGVMKNDSFTSSLQLVEVKNISDFIEIFWGR